MQGTNIPIWSVKLVVTMAEFDLKLDVTNWVMVFDALGGPLKESLARRMLVEGGVLLRDAAKGNARMAANKEGVDVRGLLAKSIYLVFDNDASNENSYTYKISWNSKMAPHGHLVEFGHWMTHKVYKGADGNWYTRKDQPLPAPVWVSARPFLRPTMDSYAGTAIRAMILRGQREFPALMGEIGK